jgi:predicted methyltransferase
MDTSILEKVARATQLREGPAGVAAVLRAVYRAGSLRLQEAAREARLPLPVATAIRRELEKAGLLERKHGLSLTETGQRFVETALGLGVTHDMTCPACGGHGIVIPDMLRPSVERLAAIVAEAPPVDVTLDQCPCVPDTAMLRALLMLQNGALEGRRVLILGDDDSLSVAIGLAGRALRQGDLGERGDRDGGGGA